jgi:hypothetical protein
MEFRRSSVFLGAAVAAAVLYAGSARAATIDLDTTPSVTMAQALVPGTVLQVGNLLFSNFFYANTNSVNPSLITIGENVSNPGEPGLEFASAVWSVANIGGVEQTQDTNFTFNVTTVGGLPVIEDDLLTTTGGATPNGSWTVLEGVSGPTLSLVNKEVTNPAPGLQIGSATFTFAPQTSLTISKDIALDSGTLTGGTASISDITQGFSTVAVPLPDAAWMGLSTLLGAGCIGAIRKRLRMA